MVSMPQWVGTVGLAEDFTADLSMCSIDCFPSNNCELRAGMRTDLTTFIKLSNLCACVRACEAAKRENPANAFSTAKQLYFQ
jgi:hypothetical protein